MEILKNARYLDEDFNLKDGNIFIENEKIIKITSKNDSNFNNLKGIDCTNLFLMPGFVNAHYHSGSNSANSLSQEMNLSDWGNTSEQGQIQNNLFSWVDEKLTNEEYEIIVLKGLIELVRQGVTSVIDSCFAERSPSVTAKAYTKLGQRVLLETYEEYANYENQSTSMLSYATHLPEEETLDEESLKAGVQLKEEYSPIFLTHSMENDWRKDLIYKKYNKSSVQIFHEKNLLNDRVILFHGTKLNNQDLTIIEKMRANLVNCPESNLSSGAGIAPIASALRKGINICLGTDWANTKFLETMRLSYQLLKVNSEKKEFNAQTIFKMATSNGASAMSLKNITGVIKEGMLADLVFIDLTFTEFLPLINRVGFTNFCHNILTCARPVHIKHVISNGEWILRDSQIQTVDEIQVNKDYETIMNKIFSS